MFSHQAQFTGGPKDGVKMTVQSEDQAAPPVLYVASTILPHAHSTGRPYPQFIRSVYRHTEGSTYAYAGETA